MLKQLFALVLGIQIVLETSAAWAFIDRQLLQKAKPFLELTQLLVVNRSPRMDCRVNHPVLGNLIANDYLSSLTLQQQLDDDRFLPNAAYYRGFLWSIGVDPDFPEPLEIYSCSAYEMLKRYVDGENVNIIRNNPHLEDVVVNGYETVTLMVLAPLSELQVVYYLVDGEREYFYDKEGKTVFPYYFAYDERLFKPAHILRLMLENPGIKVTHESISLSRFFQLMREQDANTSHELWNRWQLPEDNLLRVHNPLDPSTAPEYQQVREIIEEMKNMIRGLFK